MLSIAGIFPAMDNEKAFSSEEKGDRVSGG